MTDQNQQHKPIGGYFEWEFPHISYTSPHPGEKLVLLNSGRHALEYILQGLDNVSRVYIPYYTCEAVLDTLLRLNINYKYYSIDADLQIADYPELSTGEFIIYTNYFGIKDDYVKSVVDHYNEKVIVDNAQALYCPPLAEHQIYSPRKFIGMPDGGFAITSAPDYYSRLPLDHSFDRCKHLLKRVELHPSEGYTDFKEVSQKIAETSLSRMSVISKNIFSTTDWQNIKNIRRRNFEFIHAKLGEKNLLQVPSLDSFSCPMVYPFRTNDRTLRERMINSQIFVATYWPNVLKWCKTLDQEEVLLTHEILPIPIDQRITVSDMEYILQQINS